MSTATLSRRTVATKTSNSTPKRKQQPQPTTASHRTTVTLSPRAAEIVALFQEAAGISMSDAISELIERTEETPARIKYVDGLPMADLPADTAWITTEDILRAENEIW